MSAEKITKNSWHRKS